MKNALVCALVLIAGTCVAAGRRQFQAGRDQRLGRGISAHRRDGPRADPHQGARGHQGETQFLERPQGRHGEAGRRILDRHHDAAGSGPALLHDQHRRRRRQRSRQPGLLRRLTLRERRRSPRARARPTTPSRMCRTARCARSGTTRRSPAPGGTRWSTCRRTTKRRRRSVIRCSICSTAAAKMKPAGSGRDAPTSSSTT